MRTVPVVTYRPELDGLRAVAIVLVVGTHLFPSSHVPGWLGVDVFFVLSGYLITRLLVNETKRTVRIHLGAFYARRASRLYPAALLMIAAVTTLVLTAGSAVHVNIWRSALQSASYVANYTTGEPDFNEPFRQMWSLAVEEQFYLVWPVVLMLLLRLGKRAAGTVALVGCVASWFWLAHVGMGTVAAYHTEVRGGGLLLGCALALLAPKVSPGFGHIGVGLLIVTLAVGDHWTTKPHLIVVCGTLSAAVIIARPPQWLGISPLAALGRVSYSIYLWHYPALSLGRNLSFAGRVGVLAVACVAAVLSYRFVETPGRRWMARRLRRSQPQPRLLDSVVVPA